MLLINKTGLARIKKRTVLKTIKFIEFLVSLVSYPYAKKKVLTYHLRPYNSRDTHIWSDKTHDESKFAIVIQGPLKLENNFTLETVKIYRKTFNDAVIILSTWEDENSTCLEVIKNEGVEVVINKKPSIAGPSHVNYQTTSTYHGLIKAKEFDAKYVIKTRTDQRIYGVNLIQFFLSLFKMFPVVNKYNQKLRIISTLSHKYMPYCMSDFFNVGHIDDMLIFWAESMNTHSKLNGRVKILNRSQSDQVPEIYLTKRFLASIGREPIISIKEYWDILRDHFIVIDSNMIDLIWDKYSRREFIYDYYYQMLGSNLLSFRDWISIHNGFLKEDLINSEYIINTSGEILKKEDYYR